MRAGNLDSPAAPTDPGSAMYTLEDIWGLLNDGIWPTKRAGAFAEPGVAPGSTGHTLDQLLWLVRTRAPAARTGQTTQYAPGDDGARRMGVVWPIPRFTDNNNGTVTDNLTGLIWLKTANPFGTRAWATALNDCHLLSDGEGGPSDGSADGECRACVSCRA